MLTSLAAAFRVDRAGLRPVTAIRASAGVVVPLIIGIAAGYPAAGATAAFGALSAGIPLLTSGPRTPAGTMLATSLGMAVATFVGAISGLVPPVHLVVLAAAGFGAGLLVAAGPGATQVGVNATIALLVFGRLTATPATAAVHATWVLAGGLFQFAIAVAARSQRPLRSQRAALANAYEALAAAATADGPPPITVAEAAATAREAIRPWLQGDDRPQAQPLRGLADELDRIRQEFHALSFQQQQLTPARLGAIRAARLEAAGALAEIAAAIREGRPPAGVEPAAARLSALADQLAPQADGESGLSADPAGARLSGALLSGARAAGPRFASARTAALAGQLRAVARMTTQLAGVRRISIPISAANAADAVIVLPGGLQKALRRVRAALSPSSPAFRHAVRLAVVIPLATLISAYLPWQRGYWLPVTALIVLKPDFGATISRGVARTIGTGIGVAAGAAMVAFAHPSGIVLIVLIAACTWLGYTVFAASYAIYAIFLTAFVILLISAGEHSAVVTVENRGFDTLIGGVLAILAYLVWPTWEARTLQEAAADRFEAIRRYLGASWLATSIPGPATRRRLNGWPRRPGGLSPRWRHRWIVPAASRPARDRTSRTTQASCPQGGGSSRARMRLASHLRDASTQIAVPAAAPIVAELDQAMSALVVSLRTHSPPEVPDLRPSQRRLAVATAAGADRRRPPRRDPGGAA